MLRNSDEEFRKKLQTFRNSKVHRNPTDNVLSTDVDIMRKPSMGYWFDQMEKLLEDDASSLVTLDNEFFND